MPDPGAAERYAPMSIGAAVPAVIPNAPRRAGGRGPLDARAAAGSTASARAGEPLRRADFSLATADIAGTAPAVLHRALNCASFVCRNDDIERSEPRECRARKPSRGRWQRTAAGPHRFTTTRVVDPLRPAYPLPAVHHAPIEPPPFRREAATASAADIVGTTPAPLYRWAQRKTMDVSDIERAQSRAPRTSTVAAHDPMDVRDITGGEFKTRRVTDPLRPVHTVNGMTIADDRRSRPSEPARGRDGPYWSLLTADIPGATTCV